MNNEEKAREILECEKCHLRKSHTICDNCFDKGLLLKMAEWKEQQMIEILREKIEIEDGDIEDFANEEQSSIYGLSEKFISRIKEEMKE